MRRRTTRTGAVEPEGIRLQKYLSRAGRASRREAERLLLAGRVRVNGAVAADLGRRVVPGRDTVELDGSVVTIPPVRWIVVHKPAGVLTTRRDPHGGRTIYDILPADAGRLRYVGRLDRDTEGLLLMTNEGDVSHGLQHPSRQVEREYHALVRGTPTPAVLRRLTRGVELEDGPARAVAAAVLERRGAETLLRVVLTEGRKREVRRLLEAVGHSVERLVRVRFGPVELGGLEPGAWRPLEPGEQRALARVAEPDEHRKARRR